MVDEATEEEVVATVMPLGSADTVAVGKGEAAGDEAGRPGGSCAIVSIDRLRRETAETEGPREARASIVA